jgi:hypothetical protein
MYTFKVNRESAKHLVNITVCMTNRQELNIDFFKNSGINEAFEVGEYVAVFIFPLRSSQIKVWQEQSSPLCINKCSTD